MKYILPTLLILSVFLLSGCTASADPGDCPHITDADLSQAQVFAEDDELPFRFPLDKMTFLDIQEAALFCKSGWSSKTSFQFHAAEDYHRPPGTPVYAMAEGKVSFSGPMGGYGWLIIVDHPQFNLYSLYGHLSPSRWYLEKGTEVEKGQMIAYLGDEDENGGSAENPLVAHLHFGIRAGQRATYPGSGQWRWMAGWIKPCPADLGWMQPSAVINNQHIPSGGFQRPKEGYWKGWLGEILLTANYLIGAVCVLIYARKRKKILILFFGSVVLLAAGFVFRTKSMSMSWVIFGISILLLITGVNMLLRKRKEE